MHMCIYAHMCLNMCVCSCVHVYLCVSLLTSYMVYLKEDIQILISHTKKSHVQLKLRGQYCQILKESVPSKNVREDSFPGSPAWIRVWLLQSSSVLTQS